MAIDFFLEIRNTLEPLESPDGFINSWFTRYNASNRCAFLMTKNPFGGAVAASSAVE
jgi:hypothetical protein